MGGACGMYGRKEKRIQGFGENPERNHLDSIGVDRTIIIKCVFSKSFGMTWTGLI
jgi:hypothetical protein